MRGDLDNTSVFVTNQLNAQVAAVEDPGENAGKVRGADVTVEDFLVHTSIIIRSVDPIIHFLAVKCIKGLSKFVACLR